jgi:hypothetical protein
MGISKKKWQASKWRLLHPENHLLFADDNFLFFKAYIGAGVEVNNASKLNVKIRDKCYRLWK